ncbi:MAG: T9SS type A sorting domain-containing protein [Flavobacteriales bacterium]|nr:T9SS type A sorting domain-containing protein [Flavobacteriales bacterium]
MKKITFSIALSVITLASIAQNVLVVNGGRFGNNAENVSVDIYDTQTKTSANIDSIGTQSVQDLLIDGRYAYVAAQDSVVKYDIALQIRVAAIKFDGVSTRQMVLAPNNELVIANWYGKSSYNVYIYDQTTLALKDSINILGGIKSMVENNGVLYVNQNSSTGAPNYSDTLGSVVAADIATRSILINYSVPGYTGDIGELIVHPNGLSLYSINNVSNSINEVIFPAGGLPSIPTNTSFNQNFKVTSKSLYSISGDTAFSAMNQGIGSIDLNTLTILDSIIVDTVVTAFDYDSINANFYVTQTDFFSYTSGRVYDRFGSYVEAFATASSPEAIKVYYHQVTGLFEVNPKREFSFGVYPNPARENITVEFKKEIPLNSTLMIFNVNGQKVKEFTNLNSIQTINISDLPKGIYFVTLATAEELFSKKLIVE